MTPPRTSSSPSLIVLLALLCAACAARAGAPPPDVARAARQSQTYSARLRVSLKAPGLRARTPALIAFRRPDALRFEVPGPTGARLVAVARGDSLWAIFPGERAAFQGAATPDDLQALLGVSLSPSEVMDLLVGVPSARLRSYTARWGPVAPREITATLPDGGRLKVTVEEPETGGPVPEAAFSEPPHEGYRQVDAEEARGLWSQR